MNESEPRIGQVRHFQKTRDVVYGLSGVPELVDQWAEVYTARGWVKADALAEAVGAALDLAEEATGKGAQLQGIAEMRHIGNAYVGMADRLRAALTDAAGDVR